MWGIGLLILLAIYVGVIKLLASLTSSRRSKRVVVFVAIAGPLIYPVLYHVYPSYHDFTKLCEADDRMTIHTVKSVDYLYLGSSSMCYKGFKHLSNYKGIECGYKPKENGERGNVRGIYRYVKGENWFSLSCGESCLTKPYRTLKEECQLACMQGIKIEQFTNPYDYKFAKKAIIKNRLYLNTNTIVANDEILAEFKNYTYYPYGNEWAKILGASSGSAPTIGCENRVSVDVTEVFKPNA